MFGIVQFKNKFSQKEQYLLQQNAPTKSLIFWVQQNLL